MGTNLIENNKSAVLKLHPESPFLNMFIALNKKLVRAGFILLKAMDSGFYQDMIWTGLQLTWVNLKYWR